MSLTYRKLAKLIEKLSEEQKDMEVTWGDPAIDEYMEVDGFRVPSVKSNNPPYFYIEQ